MSRTLNKLHGPEKLFPEAGKRLLGRKQRKGKFAGRPDASVTLVFCHMGGTLSEPRTKGGGKDYLLGKGCVIWNTTEFSQWELKQFSLFQGHVPGKMTSFWKQCYSGI